MVSLLHVIAFVCIIVVLHQWCSLKSKEKYADQVVHGQVGGIAGPIINPKYFVSEEQPEEPEPHELWARPSPSVVV